jgi:6-phosphogluconolactonase
VLVGTYTEETESKGIYTFAVDATTGTARQLSIAEEVVNPSYLALSPDKKNVYAVNEAGESSVVTAFAFDANTGVLRIINDRPSPDIDPCYVDVTRTHIVTASYSSGSIAVYERTDSGAVDEVVQTIYHAGRSVNRQRQKSSHVHQTVFTPDKKFLLVCDLGTDKVLSYAYHPEEGENILSLADTLTVKLGSGPRHIALNSKGNIAYLLQELDAALSVLSIGEDGQLAILQQVTIANDSAENGAAAIHLSPDDKFVYATNRGNANNIACFAIDANNGLLTMVEQVSTGGKGPRDFAITPDGNYVFVAHQYTNNITIFERDKPTGRLAATGKEWVVDAPVCLVVY